MHGWEPAETHRGYDRYGEQVSIAQAWEVVVTREPEWSDDDRNRLLELAYYESGVCRCGYHESLTADDSLTFTPADRRCPVCAGLAQWTRQQEAHDKRHDPGEKGSPLAPRPADGRFTYMRMLSPTEAAEQTHRRANSPRNR